MERAGQGVVRSLLANWPDLSKGSTTFVVLCGPGNNGGDGFVIARHLKAEGFETEVYFYGNKLRLSDDARFNHDQWEALSGKITNLGCPDVSSSGKDALDAVSLKMDTLVIVDALFGIGLSRPIKALSPVLETLQSRRANHPFPQTRLVAVDVPSGLADQGVVGPDLELVFPADLTVTFHQLKKAHLAAGHLCGKIEVVDIGL